MFLKLFSMATVVAATLLATGPTQAATRKSCVMAGGEATMMTRGMAEFMANAALKNSIKGKDMTATGPISLKCNDPAPLTYCIARQRACK